MIGVFRDHHLGQQPGRRDASVENLSWHRNLDQGFAVIADPFATDVPLDTEHAQCVIEFSLTFSPMR